MPKYWFSLKNVFPIKDGNFNSVLERESTRWTNTAWKVFKYGVFSGTYFPAFGLYMGKYGLEKAPYLGTFHIVITGFPTYFFKTKVVRINKLCFHLATLLRKQLSIKVLRNSFVKNIQEITCNRVFF